MSVARVAAAVVSVAKLQPAPAVHATPQTRDAPRATHERPDHVRPRGGLSLGGGAVLIPEYDAVGAAVQVSARLGVQINHYFGVYYQNAPTLLFSQDNQRGMRLLAGFSDQNALLASLTLGDFFEIAAGPSLDFTILAECTQRLGWEKITKLIDSPSLDVSPCEGRKGLQPAAHAKVAFHLMGWKGKDAERTGLSFVAEAHPTFVEGVAMVLVTGGVGMEWF
jgi:hypothetical protein